MAAKKVKTKDA
jgi:hypothetical protein